MSILTGVGLSFEEPMSGFIGVGESDPKAGFVAGEKAGTATRFDVKIRIDDLNQFLKISNHDAELTGTVTCKALGGPYRIRDGIFNLFSLDAETGERRMSYAFSFTAEDGQEYFLHGHKEVRDDPGEVDVLEDMTRLFTTIHRGETEDDPVFGAGELFFKLRNGPSLVASMDVFGHTSLWQKVAAYAAFTSFAYGALRDEYLKDLQLTYDTEYENLVLSGVLNGADGPAPFFMISGVHERGFPWGDGETFWDVLLCVEDGAGGYRRYCITDRVLEGLELDVEHGKYRYQGPIFALEDGFAAALSEMKQGAPHLVPCEADIELEFDARPYDTVPFPFPVLTKLISRLTGSLATQLHEVLPSQHAFGINITPHTVTVRTGRLSIKRTDDGAAEEGTIDAAATFGEAERTTCRNIKEPTLLYGYICAVSPEAKAARVQIHSGTLRDEREKWGKDQLDAYLGTIISRQASAEMLMVDDRLTVTPFCREQPRGNLFVKLGEPIIEVNNDQFPTAIFQRRIIKVRDPSGRDCLALEEDMRRMRLEAINSDRQVTVASIRDEESKFAALDRVLEETAFDTLLEAKFNSSGKEKADFAIVIKPNFMFAYDKRDRSTYTDPELVGHLASHLVAAGFTNVAVVEAHSTYGEFFDKRSVPEMADYLGFDGAAGYRIIDMTADALPATDMGGALGHHPVSQSWRDADFRISFAKNKTHAYAYYTLTLKNIYGALPLGNKFKEYHCGRDIYQPTIEYLTAFPVHFGLIDGYLSADGPFGIFADTNPNETCTIIGGEDLVAVDWVGATKMGIDPQISQYMKLAVEAFGKPAIKLVGDGSPYHPWLNVPVALDLFTHHGLDASYHFGNLLYMISAQMDETHFTHKSRSWPIRMLRKITNPLRRTFFLRTGENPSWSNRAASWVLYKLSF